MAVHEIFRSADAKFLAVWSTSATMARFSPNSPLIRIAQISSNWFIATERAQPAAWRSDTEQSATRCIPRAQRVT
eukprot:5561261-Pleurochrysis_carterae.AAC.4